MKTQRQLGSNRRRFLLLQRGYIFISVLGLMTLSMMSGMVTKLETKLESEEIKSKLMETEDIHIVVEAKQQSMMNITEDDTLNSKTLSQSPELKRSRSNCTFCNQQKQDVKINSHLNVVVPETSGKYSYRLGDGVKGYDSKTSDKEQVCKRFPDTILCEYLQRTEEKGDISILQDIVRDWSAGKWNYLEKPGVNSTVMHLRLGDGLCQYLDNRSRCKRSNSSYIPSCWEIEGDCTRNVRGAFYAYPRDFYKPVVTDLLESVGRNSTIIIVADPSHWEGWDIRKGNYSIDMAYRDNAISFFQSNGFVTRLYNLTGIPDYDFVFMSLAQYFVRGGGGYSGYVAEVVTANGGRVFEPRMI